MDSHFNFTLAFSQSGDCRRRSATPDGSINALISIRRLDKRFIVSDGVVAAVKALDLEIAEGELFVIGGASGSGKTTLLRCIAGMATPDGGEIRIAGRVVSSDNPASP